MKVADVVANLHAQGKVSVASLGPIEIADTKQPEHGDFACNIAMTGSKLAGMNPRALGDLIAGELAGDEAFEAIEVAGPGFINFRLRNSYVSKFVTLVSRQSLLPTPLSSQKINVEFVSVNPNGPITIGSGRGAAYGSTLCNVLEAAGHQVHREYYVNDGVNSEQMRLFAESIKAILEGQPVPENGYKGDYVQNIAEALRAEVGQDADLTTLKAHAERLMIAKQREDLTAFGVRFDTWFSEQALHDGGEVDAEVTALLNSGIADTEPIRFKLKLAKGGKVESVEQEPQDEGGTLWLRSTRFGDDMDRVLRRRDGRLTYIASDVAYHKDKFNRPLHADKLITVLGPDHHGYIGRLQAVVAAMLIADGQVESHTNDSPLSETDGPLYRSGRERDLCLAASEMARRMLDVQIFQLVRFLKDGKPAPMRKRDGNIFALIDLINEIGEKMRPEGTPEEKQQAGSDVARFFYLMRSHDTTFDFDLNLAETKSDDNPVFYVQYAHARISSILRKADIEPKAGEYTERPETELIKKVVDLPNEIRRCAEDYGVHRLVTYSIELARVFHHFYNECRVIDQEGLATTQSRLALCQVTQIALQTTLGLLGVSAPEAM